MKNNGLNNNLEIRSTFEKKEKDHQQSVFYKDDNIFNFSFSMIKNFNNNVMKQKSLNTEK
jgi:hypothetical protein